MSEKSELENKLRLRNQRKAFYLSQQVLYNESGNQTMPTYKSDMSSSPLPNGRSFDLEKNLAKRFEDKMDAIKDDIVEDIEMRIAQPILETIAKLRLEILASKDITPKTFQSAYTQTTSDLTERKVLAELEDSVNDETEPKVLCEEMIPTYSEPRRDTTRTKDQYDNVTFKASPIAEFGSYSLQIRERHLPVEARRQSAIEVKIESFDERECLANALQFHVEDLIDGIVFHESELPDCLLAEGCLTDDECATVRKIRDRKDQIRVLLSLIKSRDIRVLRGFMKHIEQHNQDVAAKIVEKCEDNKRKGIRSKWCFLCQLERQFNVKQVADSLWAMQFIDDSLYNTIIYSDAPVGAQETLWKKVINSINSLCKQEADLAYNKLLTALAVKNLFTHLVDGIQNMLVKNHGMLTCACEPKLVLPRRCSFLEASTSDESVLPESSSDGTPNDLASSRSTLSTINGTITFMRYGVPHEKLIRIVEDPQSTSRIVPGFSSHLEDVVPQTVPEDTIQDHKSQTCPKIPAAEGVSHPVTTAATTTTLHPALRIRPVVPKKPITRTSISQIIKEEVIPALRYEISDIIEEKIRKLLNENHEQKETRHCQACVCVGRVRTNTEDSACSSVFDRTLNENPKPCNANFVEDSGIIKNEIAPDDVQVIVDRNNFLKSFSNPVYHHKEQTLLVQTRQGAKLVKYGPNMQHALDVSSKRQHTSAHLRRNTCEPQGLATSVQCQASKQDEIYNKGGRLSNSDERECLANALQWHVKELVDGIAFNDSELPDNLLEDGCLTEEECTNLKNKLDRKDQVRVLLCLIKGRDLDIQKKFLKHLRSYNENIANSVYEKFEQNKEDGKICTKCALCELTSRVNLKYIIDDLWRTCLIDDGLFNLIVQTDKPAGAQDRLWQKVVHSLNRYCLQSPSDVRNTLVTALQKGNHYKDLARAIGWMIYTNGALRCRCESQSPVVPKDSFVSLISSISSPSLVPECVTYPQKDGNHLTYPTESAESNELVNKANKQALKELNEETFPVDELRLQHVNMREHSVSKLPETELEKQSHQDSNKLDNRYRVTSSEPGRQAVGLQTESPREFNSHLAAPVCEFEGIKRPVDNMANDSRSIMIKSKPEHGKPNHTTYSTNKPQTSLIRPPSTRHKAVFNDEWEISDV